MKNLISRVHLYLGGIKGWLYGMYQYHSYKLSIPFKVSKMRKKEHIDVLFVLSEVSMWKTENLYLKMLSHPRLTPHLLAVGDCIKPDSYMEVMDYCRSKGYPCGILNKGESIQSKYSPDIIFYQQAYEGYIDDSLFYNSNRDSLFCFVNYCFRNTLNEKTVNLYLLNIAWKVFSENDTCTKEVSRFMRNHGVNLYNTGLPIMDIFTQPKENFPNRWKENSIGRKRIIYSPHHSILPEDRLAWGSILEYGDFILQLARKYKKETQWIFKPHPFLKAKLFTVWGVERTEAYYNSWNTMENTQMVDGDYIDIFKHSDAMIHDCGSFMIEYIYSHNPVMYLFSSRPQKDVDINKMSAEALKLHYSAHSALDIENFLQNVIEGKDVLREDRETYYKTELKPKTNSACDNIIKEIIAN